MSMKDHLATEQKEEEAAKLTEICDMINKCSVVCCPQAKEKGLEVLKEWEKREAEEEKRRIKRESSDCKSPRVIAFLLYLNMLLKKTLDPPSLPTPSRAIFRRADDSYMLSRPSRKRF